MSTPKQVGHRTWLLFLAAALSGLLAAPAPAEQSNDPLPSWNDGPAKKAIIEFVPA